MYIRDNKGGEISESEDAGFLLKKSLIPVITIKDRTMISNWISLQIYETVRIEIPDIRTKYRSKYPTLYIELNSQTAMQHAIISKNKKYSEGRYMTYI
jgi:hypothetical protein